VNLEKTACPKGKGADEENEKLASTNAMQVMKAKLKLSN